jgi:hypothetical protein
MKTVIEYAILHTPLFLSGTNLTDRLDPTKRSGLEMYFDDATDFLTVKFGGKETWVPKTNIAHITPAGQNVVEIKAKPAPAPVNKVVAQVSSPQSHVFSGPGGGQTGQSKK